MLAPLIKYVGGVAEKGSCPKLVVGKAKLPSVREFTHGGDCGNTLKKYHGKSKAPLTSEVVYFQWDVMYAQPPFG